jgi:hypothetical protein
MRARLLAAILQPVIDIEVAALKLDRFHKPVAFVRDIEAKAQRVDDALELLTFGLGLAQVHAELREAEKEEP